MADLLEALLQIRALAGTPARVARLVDSTDPRLWLARRTPSERSPVEVLAHLARAEEAFVASIRLILDRERPSLPIVGAAGPGASGHTGGGDPALELATFSSRRRETVALLATCSAAQLERAGVHPVRKLVTVADVVAIMLAHDTDHLGQILDRLGRAVPGDEPDARREPPARR